jgi:hypothetical protein
VTITMSAKRCSIVVVLLALLAAAPDMEHAGQAHLSLRRRARRTSVGR